MPEPTITALHFADDGETPNHPNLPLVLIAGALPGAAPAELARDIEARYDRHGWGGTWRYTVYPFNHYHSTAHEALTCFAGSARLRFGGTRGKEFDIGAGDAVIIPAGVGHHNLGASPDFQMCGAYPAGQRPDLLRGDPGEHRAALERIPHVPLPETDPLFGPDGPLHRHWALG